MPWNEAHPTRSFWYLVGIGLMVLGGLALGSSAFFIAIIVAAFASGTRVDKDDFPRQPLRRADPRGGSQDDEDDGIEIA